MRQLSPWVPIGIAIATLIVVPALVAIGKRLLTAWREARHARLREVFLTRAECEMQFDKLAETQAKQHEENRAYLETIRTEALQREGRVMASIASVSAQVREDTKDIRGEVSKVHGRVDNVLQMLGDRRRPQ